MSDVRNNIDITKKQTQHLSASAPKTAHAVHSPHIAVHTTFAHPRVKQLRADKFRLTSFHGWLFIICISFAAGAVAMWQTGSIRALTKEKKSEDVITPGSIPLVANNPTLGPVSSLPNEQLFSMTLEQLEFYFEEGYKSPETRQKEYEALLHKTRKEKLTNYLDSKKSPLVSIVDTLVHLKHWRLVLAISNSESSLGKRCYSNNCSGIGVAPGHPLWQEYKSKADWAVALDKLIEKRYSGWTLEQMNGTYNKPGSDNWIFAARQILNDLQSIE